MKAYRYIDGVLTEVPYQGHDFREPIRTERFVPVFEKHERRINVGIFALDLKREQKRSGVPTWFKPNLSRRKRCVAWATTPAPERAAMALRVPPIGLAVRDVRGHTFVSRDGTEAMLYLDVRERPTEAHEEDLARALAGHHALTVDDVRRYASSHVWRQVPDDVIEHEVGVVRDAFRASTGGVSLMKPHELYNAVRMVEDRVRRALAVPFL